MTDTLHLLADKLGIAKSFKAVGLKKNLYEVSDDILKFFCKTYGYNADSETDIKLSLEKLAAASWKKMLPEIVILHHDNMSFTVVLSDKQLNSEIKIYISAQENNNKQEVDFELVKTGEMKSFARETLNKVVIKLPQIFAYGYYKLEMCTVDANALSVMAVVPDKCYSAEAVSNGKLWGYALQLYSLKSKHNWGVGDFTDLQKFVKMCGKTGAAIIGLNPLNVLFHDYPENASPYSSISRLFLNPIYIDVEKVLGFDKCIADTLLDEIKDAKEGELIDYTKVYNLKIKALKKLFAYLKTQPSYMQKLADFIKLKGYDLETLATFQAIYHEQKQKGNCGWMNWDKNLRNPQSKAVNDFKKAFADEIMFFEFLQFEADRQLQEVYKTVQKEGLKVGLYRDLPVGVGKDSAELWTDKYVFIDDAGAGAPPDAFFPFGQKWCVGAFNPFELKKRAYEPFLKILRANMAYAGALRIDHVMGLMRLFMIPDNKNGGTYIHYNFEDMLDLLALESHLHKCTIVGESIGNVPEGFLDKLKAKGIYSISVVWAERWNDGNGDFKMPEAYPENAFVSVGTHDMPPLKMWWFGYDIELSRSLNLITDDEKYQQYKVREADRYKLLSALDFNQTWPADNLRKGNYIYGEGYPEGIEEALHTLLSKTSSKVVLLQPEDIFGVDKRQNFPGTDVDKYPNWRRRLPINVEDMESGEAYKRNIAAVKKFR